MAGGVAVAVGLVEGLVLDRDVGRVAHHHAITLAEDARQQRPVLYLQDVADGVVQQPRLDALALPFEALAVEQGVSHRQVEVKVRGLGEAGGAGRGHGGDQQAETGDGHGVGVEVHAMDRAQGALGQFAGVGGGLALLPGGEQAGETAQQEVAGPAGRVNQPHLGQAKGVQGRGQGVVEDEGLDEGRGLQEGIALARRLGQVLVEVAEEAGVPVRVGEVVDQAPARRIDALEEVQQALGPVRRQGQAPQGVVAAVQQLAQGGQGLQGGEHRQQIVPLGQGGVIVKIDRRPVLGVLQPRSGTRQPGLGEQAVVFEEADEDAG